MQDDTSNKLNASDTTSPVVLLSILRNGKEPVKIKLPLSGLNRFSPFGFSKDFIQKLVEMRQNPANPSDQAIEIQVSSEESVRLEII